MNDRILYSEQEIFAWSLSGQQEVAARRFEALRASVRELMVCIFWCCWGFSRGSNFWRGLDKAFSVANDQSICSPRRYGGVYRVQISRIYSRLRSKSYQHHHHLYHVCFAIQGSLKLFIYIITHDEEESRLSFFSLFQLTFFLLI